jgi:hypothetical protein
VFVLYDEQTIEGEMAWKEKRGKVRLRATCIGWEYPVLGEGEDVA